jgi:uncharacterized protein YidB (DUF937 family)
MGLMDVLNGMQNGPRGQRQPSSTKKESGGLSPIMIALIGLLAYKAMKGKGGRGTGHGGSDQPVPIPRGGTATAGKPGGTLGDIIGGWVGGKSGGAPPAGARPGGTLADVIPGGLGSLLGGAATGAVVSGGLGALIKELQEKGYGGIAQSWIGTGANQEIAPGDLAKVLDSDTLDALSQQTGLGREELLAGLSDCLPELIDQLTPQGRLPTEAEASRMA